MPGLFVLGHSDAFCFRLGGSMERFCVGCCFNAVEECKYLASVWVQLLVVVFVFS